MERYRLPGGRSERHKKLNRWLAAWIVASTLLFIANLINSPGFLWSLPFILLWTIIMGSYALKTDRRYKQSSLSLMEGDSEEQLPELEYPEVERKWKDSDFV